jgi:hypothetical protein
MSGCRRERRHTEVAAGTSRNQDGEASGPELWGIVRLRKYNAWGGDRAVRTECNAGCRLKKGCNRAKQESEAPS